MSHLLPLTPYRLIAAATLLAMAVVCIGCTASSSADRGPQVVTITATPLPPAMQAERVSQSSVDLMFEYANRPTPTPTLEELLADALEAGRIAEDGDEGLGLGVRKAIPSNLTSLLPLGPGLAERAERLWTEWVADSRLLVVDKGYTRLEEYCADGTRNVLLPATDPHSRPLTTRWAIEFNPGSRWNVATLIFDVDMPVPEFSAPASRILLDPSRVSEAGNLLQSSDGAELLFFESRGC